MLDSNKGIVDFADANEFVKFHLDGGGITVLRVPIVAAASANIHGRPA